MSTAVQLKPCRCAAHPGNVAIVTRGCLGTPQPWQAEFAMANYRKLVCFECGGEVDPEDLGACLPDHVMFTTVADRLRTLGVL